MIENLTVAKYATLDSLTKRETKVNLTTLYLFIHKISTVVHKKHSSYYYFYSDNNFNYVIFDMQFSSVFKKSLLCL